MARYIDLDKIPFVVGFDAETDEEILLVTKKQMDEMPAADVVPKSEVEKIFEEIQKIFVHRILHNESQYFEGVLDNITKDFDEFKKKYTESEDK